MPTLTRESRALIAFTLATVALLRGGSDPVTSIGVPEFLRPQGGVVISLIELMSAVLPLAIGIVALLLARSSLRASETVDAWRHLATAAFWLAGVLTVLAAIALIGWISSPTYLMAG